MNLRISALEKVAWIGCKYDLSSLFLLMLGAPFWRTCRGAAGSQLTFLIFFWWNQSRAGAGTGASKCIVLLRQDYKNRAA